MCAHHQGGGGQPGPARPGDAACRLTETLRGAQSMEQANLRGAGAAFDAYLQQYTGACDAIKLALDGKPICAKQGCPCKGHPFAG